MLTNLHLGAKVTGFNDEALGTVKSLVADPTNNQITHLVVKEDGLSSREIVVESGRLNRVSEDGKTVSLNLDKQQLVNLPDFAEREFVNSNITAPDASGYKDTPLSTDAEILAISPNLGTATVSSFEPLSPSMTNGVGLGLPGTSNAVFGNPLGPVGVPVEEKLNVPEDSLIIRQGASVEALDGHIGKIKEVNMDPATGQITSFVVEKGLFILDDYTVPMQLVERSDQDQVFVKLTKADFKNAPMTTDQPDTTNYPTENA